MSNWKWLTDSNSFYKGHVVDQTLVPLLVLDLSSRSKEPVLTAEDVDGNPFFDEPGMVWTGRTVRALKLDGVTIEIPSHDWGTVYNQVKLAKLRQFHDGTPYHKLHGWRWCLVLTPGQREQMLTAMEADLDQAEAEAERDLKIFSDGIAAANAAAGREAIVSARAQAQDVKGEN